MQVKTTTKEEKMSEFLVSLTNFSECLHMKQCTEEAHRPVDCSTVATWILKNSAESENMNWYEIVILLKITFLSHIFVEKLLL